MTRLVAGSTATLAALLVGPRAWLLAGPFVLLFSVTLCLEQLVRLLAQPRRTGAFVLAVLTPLASFATASLWLWAEVLRVLPESPARLGQATLITLAVSPGFTGLAAVFLWLRRRRQCTVARNLDSLDA